MAVDRTDILKILDDSWQPTNTVAKKLKSNWHIIYGSLCVLYKDGFVEMQEIRFSGTRKTMLWRIKKNE